MARMTPKLPDNDRKRGSGPARLLDDELTGNVIGGFYAVYNTLGYGFRESVYSRALALELRSRGLRVDLEVAAAVYYKGQVVGRCRIDQLVENRVALEIKATRALVPSDRSQLLNCLRSSDLELGLLLHFGPRPAFHRVIAENRFKPDQAVSASSA
jgi:GxxExxY protein